MVKLLLFTAQHKSNAAIAFRSQTHSAEVTGSLVMLEEYPGAGELPRKDARRKPRHTVSETAHGVRRLCSNPCPRFPAGLRRTWREILVVDQVVRGDRMRRSPRPMAGHWLRPRFGRASTSGSTCEADLEVIGGLYRQGEVMKIVTSRGLHINLTSEVVLPNIF